MNDHEGVEIRENNSSVTNVDFDRLCFFLSAPSMLIFTMLSLFLRVEANWTALAWPMGLIWLVEKLPSSKLMKAWKLSLLFSVISPTSSQQWQQPEAVSPIM